MQNLLVHTAIRTDPNQADWRQNGAGHWFNHYYGFGRLEVPSVLQYAQSSYTKLPADQTWYSSGLLGVHLPIPLHGVVQSTTWSLSAADLGSGSALTALETVEVTITLSAPVRGRIVLRLVSPAGTVSLLANQRPKDLSTSGFSQWTFMTVRHWGESAIGTWRLEIEDTRSTSSSTTYSTLATLESWSIQLRGACAAAYYTYNTTDALSAPQCRVVAVSSSEETERVMIQNALFVALFLLTSGGLLWGVVRWRRHTGGKTRAKRYDVGVPLRLFTKKVDPSDAVFKPLAQHKKTHRASPMPVTQPPRERRASFSSSLGSSSASMVESSAASMSSASSSLSISVSAASGHAALMRRSREALNGTPTGSILTYREQLLQQQLTHQESDRALMTFDSTPDLSPPSRQVSQDHLRLTDLDGPGREAVGKREHQTVRHQPDLA